MFKSSKLVLCLVSLLILWASCDKDNDFPVEPMITFKSLESFGLDSTHVTIEFTDGDGDIGFRPGDTIPPYDLQPLEGSGYSANKYYYNLIMRQERRIEGEWVQRALEDDHPGTFWRIVDLTPEGQDKVLEGEIKVTLVQFPFEILGEGDTLRFSIELIDRALNESNIVYTPLITAD